MNPFCGECGACQVNLAVLATPEEKRGEYFPTAETLARIRPCRGAAGRYQCHVCGRALGSDKLALAIDTEGRTFRGYAEPKSCQRCIIDALERGGWPVNHGGGERQLSFGGFDV